MPDGRADHLSDLLSFLDAAPSPYHAVARVAELLTGHGFTAIDERDHWQMRTGRHFVVRGGSLVAWAIDHDSQLDQGLRIVGAHTDSPNLRVKPLPDTGRSAFRQIGVEIYGGALWNSWLDRDLGVSGRLAVGADGRGELEQVLVRIDGALLRIPQLAIHLDRGVNETGLKLNPQQHLVPVWGLGGADAAGFLAMVADEAGVPPADVLGFDLMLHDLTPARLLGAGDAFISSARIDNLLSCWAATTALVETVDADDPPTTVPVICLFDHEEIGSESATGAAGTILPVVLERVAAGAGRNRGDLLRILASSQCVSADGAHATHPNYPERHDPDHPVVPNAGPVIKTNANVRYATDADTAAWFELLCRRAGVPTQRFVSRNDMPCGATIGAITAARLGIPTVDVGVAQLSMHSARELCGAHDPELFVRALAQSFRS